MKWGRLEVTGGFLLLITWINYLDHQCILPLTLVACLLHELGHYAVIYLFGNSVSRIRVTAIGAELTMTRTVGYLQEGIIALAGPGVNLLLAVLFSFPEWGRFFSGINLVLGCFNLMPVGSLDGGRTLRCTLSMLLQPDTAIELGQRLDMGFSILLTALGGHLIWCEKNPTLLLVAMWLLFSRKNDKNGGNRSCQTIHKRVK